MRLGILLSVVGFGLGVCQAAPPWGPNLWPNGSFEDGVAGWSATQGQHNEPVNSIQLTDGCAGARALRVANPPGSGSLILTLTLVGSKRATH